MARGHPDPARRSPPGTETAQSRARPTRVARCERACVRYLADGDPPIISAYILYLTLVLWIASRDLDTSCAPKGACHAWWGAVHLCLTQHPPRS